MTGENEDQNEYQEHDEFANKPLDDLGAEEEAFVLEDWDELNEVLSEVEQEVDEVADPTDGANKSDMFVVADDGGSSPDELLFVPTSEQQDVIKDPTFSEDSSRGWGGTELPAEEFGISADADEDPAAPNLQHFADSWNDDVEVQEVEVDLSDEMDFRGESGFFRADGGDAAAWQSAGMEGSETIDEHAEVDQPQTWTPLGADEDVAHPEAPTQFTPAMGDVPAMGDAPAAGGYLGEEQDYSEDGGQQQPEYDLADDVEIAATVEDDPIYGAAEDATEATPASFDPAGAEAGAEVEYQEEYPDDAEYAENYVESDWEQGEAVVRRFPVRLVAAGAAALLLAAFGVVLLKPEWLGGKSQTLVVDRADVARPRVAHLLPPPNAKLPGEAPVSVATPSDPVAVDPTPVDPGPTDPIPTPPVLPHGQPDVTPPVDPVAVVDPPPAMPIEPALVDPTPDGLVIIDGSQMAAGDQEEQRDLVAIGEELRVGEPLTGTMSPSVDPMAAGLASGDHAFVQLVNGNFFLGNVKTLASQNLTLLVEHGEVTLTFEELRGLGTVDSPEYRRLMRMEPGVIKLLNENRLAGSILNTEDDNVVIEMGSTRVMVPKAVIEEVGDEQPREVRVQDDADDAWIQALIEQRLEKKRQEQERNEVERARSAVEPPK